MNRLEAFGQLPLAFGSRRKGSVPPFARHHTPATLSLRQKRRHPKTRSGACDKNWGSLVRHVAIVQQTEALIREFGDRAGHSGIIIDQADPFEACPRNQVMTVDDPVAIGQLNHTVSDWPRKREQCLMRALIAKLAQIHVQRIVKGPKAVTRHNGNVANFRMSREAQTGSTEEDAE